MAEITYNQFLSNVHEAGGVLHPQLNTRHVLANDLSACYQPDKWCAAIALSGNILRKDPGEELSSIDITDELLGNGQSVGRVALKNILNNSRRPVRLGLPGRVFESSGAKKVDTCMLAEQWFAGIFNAMEDPDSKADTTQMGFELRWATIVDPSGTPTAIKKLVGPESALSLVPLTVNGITYPAGSLYRVDCHNEPFDIYDTQSLMPSQNIAKIAFMRLSAYAYPPDERMRLFRKADMGGFGAYEMSDLQELTAQSITASQLPDLAAA